MGTREAVSAVCFVAEEASHELLWSGPIPVAVASSVVLLLLLLLVTPSLLLPASQDPILGSYGKARGDSHALLHRHVILNWNFRVPHPTVFFSLSCCCFIFQIKYCWFRSGSGSLSDRCLHVRYRIRCLHVAKKKIYILSHH